MEFVKRVDIVKRRVEIAMEDQKNLNIRVILDQLNIPMEKFEEWNSAVTIDDDPKALLPIMERTS